MAEPTTPVLTQDDFALAEGTEAGVYAHFPFCRHICTYCDFDTYAGLDALIDPYVDAVLAQIDLSPRVRARTLYFGGGTPSLISPDRLGSLVEACRRRFCLPMEAEVTLEANPYGLMVEQLRELRAAGVNRLSLGVQSTDARILRLLGRRHRRSDASAVVTAARDAGFTNLSADLMCGVPFQDAESWRATLAFAMEAHFEHVSCYMLSVESGTPIERGVNRGTLRLPSEEETLGMYSLARNLLGATGYRHYEISNWAFPGHESLHNLTYWRNGSYLALGAGASGHLGGRRYKVAPGVRGYIEGVQKGCIPLSEDEVLDARRSLSDAMILGLRLTEGVSPSELRGRYGIDAERDFADGLEWGLASGLLERAGDRLRLTEAGTLVSNELFEKLL